MKKIIIILSVFAFIFASCNKDGDGKSYALGTFVTEIKTTNVEDETTVKINLEYVQYDENYQVVPLVDGIFQYEPKLSKLKIEGDTVSAVTYKYGKDNILDIDMESDSGLNSYKFKLNDKGLATEIFNGTDFEEYQEIQYDPVSGLRTQVGDMELISNSGNYTTVKKDGNTIIEFDYQFPTLNNNGALNNKFGIQQSMVPGSKYFWYATNFGTQNRELYKKAYVMEEGVKITYEHLYELYNGLVIRERISKDDEPYQVITYMYGYANLEYAR